MHRTKPRVSDSGFWVRVGKRVGASGERDRNRDTDREKLGRYSSYDFQHEQKKKKKKQLEQKSSHGRITAPLVISDRDQKTITQFLGHSTAFSRCSNGSAIHRRSLFEAPSLSVEKHGMIA